MYSTLATHYPQYWPESPPLCLPAPPPLSPGEESQSQVYCGLFLLLRSLENAGRSFFERYEVRDSQSSTCSTPSNSNTSQETDSTPHEDTYEAHETSQATSSRWARGPSMGWLKTATEGPNLYEVLEIEETASINEIRKQYKLLAIKYHPDKNVKDVMTDTNEKSQDQHFLKIQEAYEILSNEKFRLMYDSALPFDESIPDAGVITDDANFFLKLTPVFNRNAKWSIKKPVPHLGTESTSIEQVHRFYKFWFQFETNRDFSIHDEYDLNEAENREERRWMERENKKIHRKFLKIENQRIQNLVNLAHSKDPRILKELKFREEQKKAERERKLEKQRKSTFEEDQLREEQRKKEEEEKRIEEMNQKLIANKKKLEKQKMSKRRQRVRHLFDPIAQFISCYDLQCICTELTQLQLQNLCDELYKLYSLDITSENDEDLKTTLTHIQKKGTSEEIQFSENFRQSLKDSFYHHLNSREAKNKQEADTLNAPLNSEKIGIEKVEKKEKNETIFWSSNEITLLTKGLQRFPGGTVNRWEAISNLIGTKTAQQVIEKAKEVNANFNKKPTIKPTMDQNKTNLVESQSPVNNTSVTATSSVSHTDLHDSDWTIEQQKALEQALKKFPSSLPSTKRWQCIASEIPGKSSADCLNRCKQIRILLQNSAQKT